MDYSLPTELIAQRPIEGSRDGCRLLVYEKADPQAIGDRLFFELPELLNPGDLLVFNDSRVLPARFFPVNERSGKTFEILILSKVSISSPNIGTQEKQTWNALARPKRRLKSGDRLDVSGELSFRIIEASRDDSPAVLLEVSSNSRAPLPQLFERLGYMPIPPYIRDGLSDHRDRDDYQTIFSRNVGSVAAPTASLHFTDSLLSAIAAKGVHTAWVTLHVGPASILPIREEKEQAADFLRESYMVPKETMDLVASTKMSGGRVIAVGTTVARALESAAIIEESGHSASGSTQSTELIISPGFSFKALDCLITNFHQPKSSHLLLISAFLGEPAAEMVYQHALRSRYRFLSYGDAMFLG